MNNCLYMTRLLLVLVLFCTYGVSASAADTIIVTAEGLADPNAETYQRDKGLMLDDLRRDARRQAIEKAVGTLVSGSTLVKNYALINDQVLTQTKGLIKEVIKESSPWIGDDGFAHLLIKAEVYLTDVKAALEQMSRTERISMLKQRGNPTISVAVMIRDAKRGSYIVPERSPIAENLLKEHFSEFGYRVWSEDTAVVLRQETVERSLLQNAAQTTVSASQMKASDFQVIGEVKFKPITAKLSASNIEVTKYALTSYTVKCVDNYTGEEIYHNSKLPRRKTWDNEDHALEDIGRMIGREFNKDFFDRHLAKPTRIFQLQALGLPDYDMGVLLKKEFIGLRPVINIDFRGFDADGLSRYEVEFAGAREDFAGLVNTTIIRPLNQKCGERCFRLLSAQGDTVRIGFESAMGSDELQQQFAGQPPASLASATPQRIKELVKDEGTLEKVAAINPEAVKILAAEGDEGAASVMNEVENF